jgi:carbamoyl-phosphate synthase large subunit
LGIEGKIIAADASQLAPALFFADKHFVLPLVRDENYLQELLKLCTSEKIDLIIPTIDTELQILSDNKDCFLKNGIMPLVSDKNVVDICRDKFRTHKFLRQNGFLTPETFERVEDRPINYPLFIKPLDGSSSINAFKIKNEKELLFFIDYIPNPIIQEYISGTEFTIDVFCDFKSQPIFITIRERIAVRSGEVLKTRISKDDNLTQEIIRLVECLKPVGPITIQVIKSFKDQKYYFIEINARYGGGAPLSIFAGADSPLALYRLLKKERVEPDFNCAQNELYFLRFDQSVAVVRNGENYEKY